MIIVTVPVVPAFKEYKVITATKPLDRKFLKFREFLWDINDKPIPPYITSIVTLGQKFDRWKQPHKPLGSATFKVHLKLLDKTYLYYDFPTSVLDGGEYYTMILSEFPITKHLDATGN